MVLSACVFSSVKWGGDGRFPQGSVIELGHWGCMTVGWQAGSRVVSSEKPSGSPNFLRALGPWRGESLPWPLRNPKP